MNPGDVIAFWFEDDPNVFRTDRWFKASPEFDREIVDRFGFVLASAVDGALDAWAATAEGALALVIVLDQFSRNIHRGNFLAFAGDAHARRIAGAAISRGEDRALTPVQRVFLYMPFLHSEDPADQDRSVALFESLAAFPEVADPVNHARKRRDIVARFGRFPPRNAALGRTSTPEEEAHLAEQASRDA